MMERVARALLLTRPDVMVSYCLRDAGAIQDLRKAKPSLRFVQWPEDRLVPTLRWLEEECPDVVVLVERFRYPTFVGAISRYGAKVALMNGRCRTRKGLKYRLLAPFYRWQFAGFSAMAMQREDYFEAAQEYAQPSCKVVFSGDIKTDLALPAANPGLEEWLPDDLPLVAAGSTETAEEERMVLAAFKRLSRCRLLIAPRQPKNIEGLLENLRAAGLAFSRRSENGQAAPVMVLDTMGELTLAYGRCVAAYVGGAFTEGGGGHNVMEPLLSGVPVAYGTQRGHFAGLQKLVESEGVGTRIRDEAELADFWGRFLRDEEERRRVGEKGKALLERSRGAIAKTAEVLLPLIPTGSESWEEDSHHGGTKTQRVDL
jgi:3-deoxy-D-manno-octulosonic-acid transferase